MAYKVNEDGSVTKTPSTPPSGGSDGNSGFWITIAAMIIIAIIVFAISNNNSSQEDYPIDADTAFNYEDNINSIDSAVAPILSPITENYSSTTKGGWKHSGSVVNNYTETGGLTICKTKIDQNNACKNGCIIGDGKGVVIVGKNNYASEGIPEQINSVLKQYRSNGSKINDIVITPSYKFVVIEEENGFSNYTEIPELDKELNRANKACETIYSVAMNDKGAWAVITDKCYTSAGYFDEIERADKKYGGVYSVTMTENGLIVCCNRGVYYKNIPKNLAEALNELYWIPKYIKFTDGGTYLITDGQSSFSYYM